jgi:hypothetical protein
VLPNPQTKSLDSILKLNPGCGGPTIVCLLTPTYFLFL